MDSVYPSVKYIPNSPTAVLAVLSNLFNFPFL